MDEHFTFFELIQTAETRSYNLRATKKLVPFKCRTNHFRHSFIPSSVSQYYEHLNILLSS